LLEICDGKPQNVAVDVWKRYYDAVQKQFPKEQESRGLLPFRCWQIYDAMVSFVRAGDVDKFVCAAGILSHYVGDSCQPLHISYMFNGDPDHTVQGEVRDKTTGKKKQAQIPRGTGVHSAYEDDMVDRHVPEIMSGVDAILAHPPAPPLVSGGHAAAVTVVNLMQQTFKAIAPKDIVDAFVKVEDQKPAARADALWKTLGKDTIKVMADGCICLAQLWDSAWKEGGGDTTITALGAIDETVLEPIYQDPDFLHSYTLNTIGPVLQGQAAPAASTSAVKKSPSKRQPKRTAKKPARPAAHARV